MTDFRLQQDPDDPNVWVVFTTKPKDPDFKPWNGFSASYEAMLRKLGDFAGKGIEPAMGVSEEGKAITLFVETGEGKDKRTFTGTLRAAPDGQSEVVMNTTNTPVEKAGVEPLRATGPKAEAALAQGVINWLLNNGQMTPQDFEAMFAAAKQADPATDKPKAKPADEPGPAKPGA